VRDAVLDLNAVLARAYEVAACGERVRYGTPPPSPTIPAADEGWIRERVRATR
jgi:hypothetical protein